MSIQKSIKSLVSDSLIYGIAGVISRFIGFFLTPLYTRVYSPSDYGVLGMLNNGYMLVTIILILALDNSTARWFYDTDDYADRKSSINTWLWFYLFFSLAATFTLFISAHFISRLLFGNSSEGYLYIRILSITLPIMLWMGVANNVLRFERKVWPTVSLTLLYTLTLIGLNVVFVLILNWGLKGAFYAQLGAALFSMPFSIYLIRSWIGPISLFEFSRLKQMIRYSIPFVPASIAYWLVNLSGVFFVNAYLSKSEAGLYHIGISIAAVAGLGTTAFQQAWSPFAFSIINQPNARHIYANVFYLYVLGMGGSCMLVSLFAPEALILLTTPEYYNAAWVISILSFGYLAIGLTSIADLGTAIVKKTAPLGIVSVLSAVLLIILNILFIPAFGKEGAALSICISQFIVPFIMFYISQKVYPIPYNFKKAILASMLIIIASVSGRMIHTGQFFIDLSIKLLILLAVLLFLYIINKSYIKQAFLIFKQN